MKKLFSLFVYLLLTSGCGGMPTTSRPLPASDAPLHEIWDYAATLQVERYAGRRFGSYPDGLRKAVTQHRIAYFTSQQCPGGRSELQSYLFFEYRRHRSLGGEAMALPDEQSERYIRALVAALANR